MNPAARLPVLTTVALGLGGLVVAAASLDTFHPIVALLFLFGTVYSEMNAISVSLGQERKEVTFSLCLILAVLLIEGWPLAVLLAATAVAIADTRRRKPLYKVAFNAGVYAIATLCAGLAYQYILGLGGGESTAPFWMRIIGGLAGGITFYVLETFLLMTVIARVQGGRPGRMFRADAGESFGLVITLTSIAIIMASLWFHHPMAALLVLPSIYMTRSAYEAFGRLRSEAQAMLAALADVLDLRDFNTGRHMDRVATMAWGVATALGLPEDQARAVQLIGRVHDIGKVAVSDSVLRKPGRYSEAEMQEVRTHVQAGGQILSYLSVYRPLIPILMQHHERPDGRGYPAGLRAETIEMGARILAACDAYDAMTSNRPYRLAIAPAEAMAELHRCAGSQFDPKVVEALETWLIAERKLRPNWRTTARDLPLAQLPTGASAPPVPEPGVEQPRAGTLQFKY